LFSKEFRGKRLMARQRRYNIPVAEWLCPHCGFVHRAADLLRLNNDDLQCHSCGQAFPAVLAQRQAETQPSADLKE
jgi:hypothetical protein